MSQDNTPAAQVWPTLKAHDADALIRFLVDAFGFEETMVIRDGDPGAPEGAGRVEHAQLDRPEGGGIMLGSVRGPDDPWPLKPGTFGAYVVTGEPDALFKRAVAAGAQVMREPYDTDYGSRDFMVRDPEGNLWSFGTYRGQARG